MGSVTTIAVLLVVSCAAVGNKQQRLLFCSLKEIFLNDDPGSGDTLERFFWQVVVSAAWLPEVCSPIGAFRTAVEEGKSP
jgi:hypothetical protein